MVDASGAIRRQHLSLRTSALALIVGAALASGPARAQPTADPAASGSAGTMVADVVVTAQRREQNLQSVPISITALNETALVANRIETVRDLNSVAPNLTVREGPGGVGIPNFSMRGLVTAGTAAGTDKGISVYIDGVYLQNAIGSIFDLADVERIEVLKGPQGTLFGRNATGGAISLITRNPTGEFGVRQDLTFGNYAQFRTKTRVDLPKWGPLSAAVTFLHSERRGDVENLGAGTIWDFSAAGKGFRTSPKTLGDKDINSVSFAARLDLIDNLDVLYKFDYTHEDNTPGAQGLAGFNPAALGLAAFVLTAQLAAQPNPALLTPITSQRPAAVNNAYSTPGFVKASGNNLTVRYTFNDKVAVKNILSYRTSEAEATFQLDGYGGLFNTLPFLGPVGAPFNVFITNAYDRQWQWSNETQINVNTDWVTLTAGYIHFRNHQVTGGFNNVFNNTFFAVFPDNVIPANGNRQTFVDVTSDALYAQGEIHVTKQVDVIGGVRVTKDKKSGVDNGNPSLPQPISYDHTEPTYLVGVNYQPTDRAMLYAKLSTGYISGGFLGANYDPETAKSYEIGAKTDLFDRRLRANLAIFDVKYSGLQLVTTGANVGLPATLVVINAGAAKAKGFELETTAVPMEGLTLTGNVGYTDFHYTSVNPLFGTVDTYRPQNRPKWTSQASVQYETPEIDALKGGRLSARVDVSYASKTYLSAQAPTPALVEATTTAQTFMLNSRVALTDMEVHGAKIEVALWGRNLFDNRQLEQISDLQFAFPGNYRLARTFGVDISAHF